MSDHQSLDTEIDLDERVRLAAIEATNAFFQQHLANWPKTGGELNVDSLRIRPSETDPGHLHATLRSGNKERELLCPLEATDRQRARLVPENVLFTQADALLLVAGVAYINRYPVEVLYRPFHEIYRAHPNGTIEIVQEPRKREV